MPIVTPHLSFLTFVGYTPSQERYGTHTSMGVAGARGASQQTPMTHEPPVETTTIQHKYKVPPNLPKKASQHIRKMPFLAARFARNCMGLQKRRFL